MTLFIGEEEVCGSLGEHLVPRSLSRVIPRLNERGSASSCSLSRTSHHPLSNITMSRRYHVVVNPVSGSGKAPDCESRLCPLPSLFIFSPLLSVSTHSSLSYNKLTHSRRAPRPPPP